VAITESCNCCQTCCNCCQTCHIKQWIRCDNKFL